MSKTYKNYVAGEWADAAAVIENINPSDRADIVGSYAQADGAQLNRAVAAANEALPAWRETTLETRQAMLDGIGRELMARAGELGELLSREEGKPLAEGKGEITRAGQFFVYYAHEVLRQIGQNADSVRAGVEIDVRREPMGAVAVISPWNFPTAAASWKIAPALAFGNTVIWKPSNQTPASAWALAEIISRAGAPAGVFQLLMGAGREVGEGLARHAGIAAVTFTGSYESGKQVAAACASNLTKFQLELGSKNALTVMDDADLDAAAAAALAGGYSGSGQKCTASSRLLVHEKVYDEFLQKLTAAVRGLKVGHALAEGTQIGPIINMEQLTANLAWIDRARAADAELLCGGERLTMETDGYYMSPALLAGTRNDMDFNRAEMFAPIVAAIRIGSCEEALAVTNDTPFGLVSGIFTRSLARAAYFRRHAQTGCVMVNLPTAGTDYHVPFGGRKNSSFGPREQGGAAAEFYTQMKTAYIRAGEPE